MNNKGFTLIEIIAVVGLLALIGTMIGTSLVTLNQQQNLKNYETYKETIADAACIFFESDDMTFYSSSTSALANDGDGNESYLVTRQGCLGGSCYVSAKKLIQNGYLDENLKNPTTGTKVNGATEYVRVSFAGAKKTCTYVES